MIQAGTFKRDGKTSLIEWSYKEGVRVTGFGHSSLLRTSLKIQGERILRVPLALKNVLGELASYLPHIPKRPTGTEI